jgi:predicted DNA-binding transcriptional regulator AlpA
MFMISTINDESVVLPRYLTAEQCAIRFAISLRHFKYLVSLGDMPPPVKFGKCSRWSLDILELFDDDKKEEHSGFRRRTSRPKKSRRFSGSAR